MFIHKVRENIIKYNLLEKKDKVVVGISGGADSICLLHVLWSLKDEFDIALYGVHINHKIRQETAKRDELHAKAFCEQYHIPFFCFERDIPQITKKEKMSEEEAGRKIRYECFHEVLEQVNANKIAVAHHKNDQAETFLLHLCRGSGLEGLSGMYPKREKIIRPLLFVTREEIEQYLYEHNIAYKEDETNKETIYARNKIRHEILPNFESVNQKTVDHIAKTCEIMQETAQFLQKITKSEFEKVVEREEEKRSIVVSALSSAEPFLQKQFIKNMIEEMAGAKKDIASSHILSVLSLKGKEVGKKINLPYNLEAVREYEKIVVRKKKSGKEKTEKALQKEKAKVEYVLKEGEQVVSEFGFQILVKKKHYFGEEISKKTYTKYFDYDRIKSHIVLRHRREGDYLIINEKGDKKSLKRFFIDEKIPREERENILLFADGSHIIWIVGRRISEYYKVSDATREILVVEAIKTEKNTR